MSRTQVCIRATVNMIVRKIPLVTRRARWDAPRPPHTDPLRALRALALDHFYPLRAQFEVGVSVAQCAVSRMLFTPFADSVLLR